MSILIADSGSTKTAWVLLKPNTTPLYFHTEGINPYYQDLKTINANIANLHSQLPPTCTLKKIFFYGAGCSNIVQKSLVKDSIRMEFEESEINVAHDMIGASRSVCQGQKGIVCILGTGSNACLYDGIKITTKTLNFGFWLGDEGSGGHIGKKLIMSIMHKEAPASIITLFEKTHNLSSADLVEAAYQKPFPNRFFAQYSKFVKTHIQEPFLYTLVQQSFKEFLEKYIMPLETDTKINFVGSIAFHFSDILQDTLKDMGLTLGTILKDPIDGLVLFHQKEI